MAVPKQSPDVAFRVIDEVAVLVTAKDPDLYWLNPVATRVWELADGSRDVDGIADEICAEFEVDKERALRDVEGMVASFVEKQLFVQGD